VPPAASRDHRHRFPGELIRHAVWRAPRFLLSFREVEELLAERGIAGSCETVRRWCTKVGQVFAAGRRRGRPRPGDRWHGEEVQRTSDGRPHWLGRAVDRDGTARDLRVQPRRDQAAAAAFRRRVVGGWGDQPRGGSPTNPPAPRRPFAGYCRTPSPGGTWA
jgi:putative transposase